AIPTFSPASVTGTGSSTLNITTTATEADGTYPLTITATSGALTHTAAVTEGNSMRPDSTYTASPAAQTIAQGGGTTYTASTSAIGGFAGSVSFPTRRSSDLAIPTFSPASVTGTGSSTLNITTTAAVAAGTYPLTITATSGALTHTAAVTDRKSVA